MTEISMQGSIRRNGNENVPGPRLAAKEDQEQPRERNLTLSLTGEVSDSSSRLSVRQASDQISKCQTAFLLNIWKSATEGNRLSLS